MIEFDNSVNKMEDKLLREEVQDMKFEGVSKREIGNFLESYATIMYLNSPEYIQKKKF